MKKRRIARVEFESKTHIEGRNGEKNLGKFKFKSPFFKEKEIVWCEYVNFFVNDCTIYVMKISGNLFPPISFLEVPFSGSGQQKGP